MKETAKPVVVEVDEDDKADEDEPDEQAKVVKSKDTQNS